MHLHLSAIGSFTSFLMILVWGTLWRLLSLHLTGRNPDGSTANKVGRAMAIQY